MGHQPHTIAFTLSASIFTASVVGYGGPASAQQISPAPQASPAPQGSAAPPQASPSAQSPAPATQGSPASVASPPAAPYGAPGMTPANGQNGGLPVPPVPIVMPAVPPIPGYSAPVNAVPNGNLVGVQQMPFVGLNLQDAIAMALQRNTNLAISQSNRRIAHYQIVAAKGAYDVRFQLIPSYSYAVAPVISPFSTNATGGPVTTDTAGVTTQLRGDTASGGQYAVGVTAQRIGSNNIFNSYNPYFETALQLSLTQPLLRGAAVDQRKLQVQLSQVNSSLASSTTLLDASNTVVQVQDAYYDLVSAWQNVAIQEEGLRNATAQAESNRRLAARGAVAPTDIVEANTQVNVFQDNVFAAIQNVQRVQMSLKTLILANPGDPVWMANLVPTTPVAQVPSEPSLEGLVSSAIQNRPEIAQVRAQRQQSEYNLAYSRDQLKPQLDAGLGYTTNGFAGTPLSPTANPLFALLGQLSPAALAAFPPPPAYQTGGLGRAFSSGFLGRFPQYNAQLTLSIPLGNRTAKANYAISQEQQRQVQLSETSLVQRIRSEAVNAIQGLREAQYRVIAARAAREAAQRVLLGEQRRFQAGTSTTFLVLQRQLDVANQEGRELQAQIDLDKSIVELNRVSGGIFVQNGIDVNAVGIGALNASGPSSILPAVGPSAAPQLRRTPASP